MDQNQPPLPLLVAMLLAIGGSIAVWGLVALRMRVGQVVVPREPRRPVPWHVWHVIAVVLFYVLTQVAVTGIVLSVYQLVLPGVDAPGAVADDGALSPEKLAPALLGNAMANLIVVGATTGLLSLTAGATAWNFGFRPFRLVYDVPLGVAAFLASLLPVYAIQLVLTQFFPSHHPVQQLLTSDSSAAMLVLCGFSAVLVAPIAEEFLFRGILQGWLEAAVTDRRRQSIDSIAGDGPNLPINPHANSMSLEVASLSEDAVASSAEAAVNPYQSPGAMAEAHVADTTALADKPRNRVERLLPVGVSSLLFALVHLGHGPDPIPLFVLALILGYLYQQTHRLWPCIVLHMCLNAASLAMLLASLDGR
jgi:membrane protease YdiL (CAAX protease family)